MTFEVSRGSGFGSPGALEARGVCRGSRTDPGSSTEIRRFEGTAAAKED